MYLECYNMAKTDETIVYTSFFMIMFFAFNLIALGWLGSECFFAWVPLIPALFLFFGPRIGMPLFVLAGMVAISLQAYYTGYYNNVWLWFGLVFLNLSSLVGHFMKKMDDSKKKKRKSGTILLGLFALSALGVLTGVSGDIDGDNALAMVLLVLLILFNVLLILGHVWYAWKKEKEYIPVAAVDAVDAVDADAPKPVASTLRF